MLKIQKILFLIIFFFSSIRSSGRTWRGWPLVSGSTTHNIVTRLFIRSVWRLKYISSTSSHSECNKLLHPKHLFHLNTRLCKTRPAPTGQDCKWITRYVKSTRLNRMKVLLPFTCPIIFIKVLLPFTCPTIFNNFFSAASRGERE